VTPIRPGTARRLGLYQPDPPPPAPFTPEWAAALGASKRHFRESVRHIRRINAEKRS
jgi:hypothetical protein